MLISLAKNLTQSCHFMIKRKEGKEGLYFIEINGQYSHQPYLVEVVNWAFPLYTSHMLGLFPFTSFLLMDFYYVYKNLYVFN